MKRQIGCLALAVVFAMNAVAGDPARKDRPKAVHVQRFAATPAQKAERRAVRAQIVANQIREINAVNRAEFIGGLAGTLTGLWIRHMLDNRAQKAAAAQYYQPQPQASPLVFQADNPPFGEFGGNKPGSLEAPMVASVSTAIAAEKPAEAESGVQITKSGVRIIGLE